jgi:SAM-dependent methyltransferase
MRVIDRLLQQWRASVARPFIPPGARVLDIGCHQGEFLQSLGSHIGPSVGIDPLGNPETGPRYRLIRGLFQAPMPFSSQSFDAVVMLATLEHIREKDSLSRECFRLLSPGGRVIITVPSKFVDTIVEGLCLLRLAHGMSVEEHHGYDPNTTPAVFRRHGFTLKRARCFQLGLNHLFVFQKPHDAQSALTSDVAMGRELKSTAGAMNGETNELTRFGLLARLTGHLIRS